VRKSAGRAAPPPASNRHSEIGLRYWSERIWREPAMRRFVHRIIMAVLLIAALAIIWNVLGAR
jgi:hypothetical protein